MLPRSDGFKNRWRSAASADMRSDGSMHINLVTKSFRSGLVLSSNGSPSKFWMRSKILDVWTECSSLEDPSDEGQNGVFICNNSIVKTPSAQESTYSGAYESFLSISGGINSGVPQKVDW